MTFETEVYGDSKCTNHRFNMELDLHSLFGLPVHHSYTHWLRPATRIWAHIRGRYWSAKIDDIPLRPPCTNTRGSSLVGFTEYNMGGVEIEGVYLPSFSWCVHHSFERDGRYCERGLACTPHPN